VIYLLDTDTLVFMVRGLKSVRQPARQRAELLARRCEKAWAEGAAVGLSAITVSELEFGAQHSSSYEAEMAACRKVMAPFTVYDYDVALCPPAYGRIRHDLESRGATIGGLDLLIAAHALALGATLVSNNQAHFARIQGLRTETWLTNKR
jgi:tRNA(fMet)-specific endonuclease VapC